MQKYVCDRCQNEFPYESRHYIDHKEGEYEAELLKVIRINDDAEEGSVGVLCPASHAADLCPKCQNELNRIVMQFMKYES